MYKDKKILYAVSVSILSVLLLAWLITDGSGRTLAALLLLPSAVLTALLIRKRNSPSYNKWQVLMLTTVIAVMFLVILYMTGLHFGFIRPTYLFSFKNLVEVVLPIAIIIVSSEIIRRILCAQDDRVAGALGYLICLLGEMLIVSSLSGIRTFNQFMDMVGMTIFPAVTANLLYHYLAKRYGILPNLVFRLLTTLYAYILPVVPAIPDSLLSFIMLALPFAVYLFLDMLYERKLKFARHRKPIVSYLIVGVVMSLMLATVMLTSNQFRFGSLVIATESMTGELNKGDTVIFDKEDEGAIQIGQVIVFERNNSLFVHRVVNIKVIDGETQYFTKGDANDEMDPGYVTRSLIVGVAKGKIPYMGYPTLWMRSLFEKTTGGVS